MKAKLFGIDIPITTGERDMTSGAMGRADTSKPVIWLWNGLPKDKAESTLVHEWLHCVSDALHMDFTEQQICGLESALYSAGFRVKTYPDNEDLESAAELATKLGMYVGVDGKVISS